MQQLTAKSGFFLERTSLRPHESIIQGATSRKINGGSETIALVRTFLATFFVRFYISHGDIVKWNIFIRFLFYKVSFLQELWNWGRERPEFKHVLIKFHRSLVFLLCNDKYMWSIKNLQNHHLAVTWNCILYKSNAFPVVVIKYNTTLLSNMK